MLTAGLVGMRRSFTAAPRAERRVAWTRRRVADFIARSVWMERIAASPWWGRSSLRRRCPRLGVKYWWTWAV